MKILIHTLTLCALILYCSLFTSCATPSGSVTAEYQQFLRGYELKFGAPQSQWTNEQRVVFMEALQNFHQQRLAQIDAPRRKPIAFPVIQPPIVSMPQPHQGPVHTQVKPDGYGGYDLSNSDGSTQKVQRDQATGGFTVWDNDGTTHRIVPDGHGGWTRY